MGETVRAHPVGAIQRGGKTGKGNHISKGRSARRARRKTDTFLGERYRRIVKRRGKLKALVAVARSILVIIWHLLNDPAARLDRRGEKCALTCPRQDSNLRHRL